MFKKSFLLLFTLVFIISCHKEKSIPQTTKVKFVTINAAPVLLGGMFIYAVNADNPGYRVSEFFTNENEVVNNEQFNAIPNGNWQFFAIGFKAASTPMDSGAGDIVCGSAENGATYILRGQVVNISIDLSLANCNSDSNFAVSDFLNAGTIKDFEIRSCTREDFAAVTGFASTCVALINGAVVYGFIPYPLRDYTSFNSEIFRTQEEGFEILSLTDAVLTCKVASTAAVNLGKLPGGNPNLFDNYLSPFLFVVASYSSGNCTDTKANRVLKRITYFTGGIGAGLDSFIGDPNAKVFTDGTTVKIFFNADLGV